MVLTSDSVKNWQKQYHVFYENEKLCIWVIFLVKEKNKDYQWERHPQDYVKS